MGNRQLAVGSTLRLQFSRKVAKALSFCAHSANMEGFAVRKVGRRQFAPRLRGLAVSSMPVVVKFLAKPQKVFDCHLNCSCVTPTGLGLKP